MQGTAEICNFFYHQTSTEINYSTSITRHCFGKKHFVDLYTINYTSVTFWEELVSFWLAHVIEQRGAGALSQQDKVPLLPRRREALRVLCVQAGQLVQPSLWNTTEQLNDVSTSRAFSACHSIIYICMQMPFVITSISFWHSYYNTDDCYGSCFSQIYIEIAMSREACILAVKRFARE